MMYGQELIDKLNREIESLKADMSDRSKRISDWQTDEEDCFVSQRCDERAICLAQDKIELLKNGGCEWFTEYATLDGTLVSARWCKTKYGTSLRACMPDGSIVWTTSSTAKGLAKKGLKKVLCLRPAWFAFHSNGTGMFGVYTGQYVTFPSDVNYATGEAASADPIEIKEWKEAI